MFISNQILWLIILYVLEQIKCLFFWFLYHFCFDGLTSPLESFISNVLLEVFLLLLCLWWSLKSFLSVSFSSEEQAPSSDSWGLVAVPARATRWRCRLCWESWGEGQNLLALQSPNEWFWFWYGSFLWKKLQHSKEKMHYKHLQLNVV